MSARRPEQGTHRIRRYATGITLALCCWVLHAQAQDVAWDHSAVVYGTDDPARQFLNIYLADTAAPAPVYFFAHSNGGTAYGVPQDQADAVKAAGYTLVSWESATPLSNPEDIAIAWSDAQLAFDWVRANAGTYNIDPDRIIIAGRSRGSVASWPLAHSGHAAIQGIYMYNALPNSVWAQPELWSPVDNVNADSPPIYMVYGPTPGDGDNHAPENAYPIRDQYIAFGLGDTFTTYDSMQANGISNVNHYFAEFVESIEPSGPPANMVDNFDGGNTLYPWTENGTWIIAGGTYNQDDNTGNKSAYAGNSAWTNYTFKADMVTINSANPSTGWMAGSLAFRVTDTDNLYFVRLHNNGDLRLLSIVDGTNSLITSVPTAYSPTTWHTYTIVVSGNSIKVSIDSELLIDVTDTDHGAGYIGVRTNQNGVAVDNVAVTQPPGC